MNFHQTFLTHLGLLGHVGKECNGKVWKEEAPQFGGWLRASQIKKREARGCWSEGESSGESHHMWSSGSVVVRILASCKCDKDKATEQRGEESECVG